MCPRHLTKANIGDKIKIVEIGAARDRLMPNAVADGIADERSSGSAVII